MDVLFTDWQTSGKGRAGRKWTAEKGETAAFSIVLKSVPPKAVRIIPHIMGLSVAEALENLVQIETGLKWPNDVIALISQDKINAGKKICGILCESVTTGNSTDLVAGAGINILQSEESFVRTGLPWAASVFSVTQKRIAPIETVKSVFNAFVSLYESVKTYGFTAVKDRYSARCVTLNKDILVNGERAYARAITDDGELLCDFINETRAVTASEVSVRGLYGYI